MTENTTPEQPYKDDTSDGTTAKTAQQIAEETVDQVRSTDDAAREATGLDRPEEGHDVRDYRPVDLSASVTAENPGHPDYQPQDPRHAGDDEAVDENGDDVDTADDKGE